MSLRQTFNTLPFVLTDAGLETDMIFNRGFELPAFAAHTLLDNPQGRAELEEYFRLFLELASETGAAFIMDAPTWRAQSHFADELGANQAQLRDANHEAVRFVDEMRGAYRRYAVHSILNAQIGPRGDAYIHASRMSAADAETYHYEQISWLAETPVDMVTAMTFTNSAEAIGVVRAAGRAHVPVAVSFTVETDGRLPSGETLEDAIVKTDRATDREALHFMVNCAHPDHFCGALKHRTVLKRLRGVRCNASRKSHSELDCCTALDRGDCDELAALYSHLKIRLPWLNIWGGCCGTDVAHIAAIAQALKPLSRSPMSGLMRAAN